MAIRVGADLRSPSHRLRVGCIMEAAQESGPAVSDEQSINGSPWKAFRVLDFGMAAVGPLSATYLGVLGADVIKIEQPTGDVVRRGSGATMQGMGCTFIGNNYTKRGMMLDLKDETDPGHRLQAGGFRRRSPGQLPGAGHHGAAGSGL